MYPNSYELCFHVETFSSLFNINWYSGQMVFEEKIFGLAYIWTNFNPPH